MRMKENSFALRVRMGEKSVETARSKKDTAERLFFL